MKEKQMKRIVFCLLAVALFGLFIASKLEYVAKDEAVFCDGELRSATTGLHWKNDDCVVEVVILEATSYASVRFGKKNVTVYTKIKTSGVADYITLRKRVGERANFTPNDLAKFAMAESQDMLTILREIAEHKSELRDEILSEQTKPVLDLLKNILDLKDIESMEILRLEISDM